MLKIDTFEYEPGGSLKKVTDRRGLITAYWYDILGRNTFTGFKETLPLPVPLPIPHNYESSITSTYDKADRLKTAIDTLTGTITLDYDPLGRLKSETTPRGSVAYSYDANGRRTAMTVGGQPQVAYGYDNADRLTSITQGSQAVGFDRQTSQSMPGGITTDYGYNNASQLTDITHKAGASTLGNLAYSYDLGGRRNSVSGSFARTALPAAVSSASYDAGNRLKTWGSATLSYDNAGNLTADGSQNYTWNSRGELASISGASTASYAYDAFGRRSKATVAGVATDFHYDGGDVVQELTGTTPKSDILGGLGTDQRFTRTDATGTKSYLTDALGSTVALADQSGALQTQYTYTPFGKTTQSGPASTNTFQFTGRENDGTGLQYNRARYYNPTFGRFISEDPMGFAAGDPNLYGYVGNSPFNLTDPSGMSGIPSSVTTGFWNSSRAGSLSGRKDLGSNSLASGSGEFSCDTNLICGGARYLYRHTNVSYGGCYVVCSSITFAHGHFYLAVGGVGYLSRGFGVGWTSVPPEEQGDIFAMTCAAWGPGGCVTVGTRPNGSEGPVETWYGFTAFTGVGVAAGGMYQWKLL